MIDKIINIILFSLLFIAFTSSYIWAMDFMITSGIETEQSFWAMMSAGSMLTFLWASVPLGIINIHFNKKSKIT